MSEKERILVVDDEPSIRKYLGTLLEVEGYEVETVVSGQEAIEKIEAGDRPDFIILDVLMPELNGLETLKQLMHDRQVTQRGHAFLLERSGQRRRSHPPGRAGLPDQAI